MTENQEISSRLDKVAKGLEKRLQRYFPGFEFSFTHRVYCIYKQQIVFQEGCPLVVYNLVKEREYQSQITRGSRLLIIAEVKAFGREHTVQIRCLVNKKNGELVLQMSRAMPVEILDTQYSSDEEKKGIVRFPRWLRDYQDFIGALILAATEAILKFSGL